MRLVLDTNVLVSALLSSTGPPSRLLDLWRDGRYRLVTSTEQADELNAVLARPKLRERADPRIVEELLRDLGLAAEVLTELPTVRRSPDPNDDFVLAMAIAGQADLLVTGDTKDLLVLGTVQGVPIVTPAEAVERLTQPG